MLDTWINIKFYEHDVHHTNLQPNGARVFPCKINIDLHDVNSS